MYKRQIMKAKRKSPSNGLNLGFGSDHVALKSQVLLSRSFLAVLVLVFLLMSKLVLYKVVL